MWNTNNCMVFPWAMCKCLMHESFHSRHIIPLIQVPKVGVDGILGKYLEGLLGDVIPYFKKT
ncbi:hypothetical protein SESBI_12709 [Sesbania bispinosa]|nr:hypothetical protein SESBI_12709 [Sesbania bispinosa]